MRSPRACGRNLHHLRAAAAAGADLSLHHRHHRLPVPQARGADSRRDWDRDMAETESVPGTRLKQRSALRTRRRIAAGAEPGGGGVACQIASSRPKPRGQAAVGLSHFLDYLDALRRRPHRRPGRARDHPAGAGDLSCPTPRAARRIPASTAPSTISPRRRGCSAWRSSRRGTPTPAARSAISPGGWPSEGLVAFAATNGPALLAGSGSTKPVYCTNPMSFAAPVAGRTAAGHRPVVERHRLRQHPQGGRGGARNSGRLGARRRRAGRPPIRPRR